VYETVCNTTIQATVRGGSSLPVTTCDQEKRRICAEDSCYIVEGEPECAEKTVENTVETPEETCSMEPVEECKNVTISIPNLIPEEICRSVPKEVCQVVFLNPRTVKTTAMVKYCMNLQTGSVREGPEAEAPAISPRRNVNLERLIDPRTGDGFRPVTVPLKDLPPQLQTGRGKLRKRKGV